MTLLAGQTNGPDPRRPTLNCLRYHERPVYQEGTLHGCCCCDPCLYIRIGVNRDLMWLTGPWPVLPVAECCRCIPRAIFFRFTPDNYAEPCCHPMSELVWPTIERGALSSSWLKAVYSGNLFGYVIELTVGRFREGDYYGSYDQYYDSCGIFDPYHDIDDPYDPYCMGYCAWQVRVSKDGQTVFEEEFPMEASSPECLRPPDIAIEVPDGPPGCTGGVISFVQFVKDKLPYVQRGDDSYGYYSGQPKFIDLCPSDCEGYTPNCLAVQDYNVIRQYEQIADIDGYPAWAYDDGVQVRRIQWDQYQSQWVLISVDSNETLAVGGDDPTCPLGVWHRPVQGDPYGYEGYYDYYEDMLPFCVSLCDPGGYPEDTPTAFVCGDCTQACSTVCVSGNWRDRGWEFIEFGWERKIVPLLGTPDYTIEQGWKSTDPITGAVDYLYLENNPPPDVLVNGIRWSRDYDAHGFGDEDYPYWKGSVGSADAFVYWSPGDASWAIMVGGNRLNLGPITPNDPEGTYVPINPSDPTYVVSLTNDDYGDGCILRPQFASNNFLPITITSGCSCALFEGTDWRTYRGYHFEVHCGICSCYDFYCGSCRCVPDKICLHWVYDGAYSGGQILTWDEELKQWGDDATSDITIHLERGDNGQCELVPYMDDEYGQRVPLYLWTPEDSTDPSSPLTYQRQYTVYDCHKELYVTHVDNEFFQHPSLLPSVDGSRLLFRHKCRKQITDWLGLTHYGFKAEGEQPLYLYGASFTDDCILPKCASFFYNVCPDECMDEPETLHATLIGKTGADPYEVTVWSVDVEIHLFPQLTGASFNPPAIYCNYIGAARVVCDLDGTQVEELWIVSSTENGFAFAVLYWEKSGGALISKHHSKVFTGNYDITCDPLYAETEWEEIGTDPLTEAIPGVHCTSVLDEFDRATKVKLVITK